MDTREIIKDLELLWDLVHSRDTTISNVPEFIYETAKYIEEVRKQDREEIIQDLGAAYQAGICT